MEDVPNSFQHRVIILTRSIGSSDIYITLRTGPDRTDRKQSMIMEISAVSLPVCGILYYSFTLVAMLAEGKFEYSPGDTRLLDYTAFCQGLTVKFSNPALNIGPSVLYVLNSLPTLIDTDSFSFCREEILNNPYEWSLHFYDGSVIEVSGCTDGNKSAQYYLIKGKEGFDDWKSNSQSNSAIVNSLKIDSTCATGTYSVKEEDQYFLVFQSVTSEASSLNVNITFTRAKYAMGEDQYYVDKQYFNASRSSSVQTPIDGSNYVLLVYGDSSESPEYWNTLQLDVDVNCEPRIWFYVVVIVGPVVMTLLLLVGILCCVLYVSHRSKKRSAEDSPLLHNWDDMDAHHSYYRYSEPAKRLDPLTELAIAAPDTSNPHIAQFKEDLRSPSFQDEQVTFGSPKFSTFKP